MFISLRQLLEARRYGVRRAVDLAQLRVRFAGQPGGGQATVAERELAIRLRDLKTSLAAAFGDVTACAACARNCPPPAGRWTGGRCCGTATSAVFTTEEVRALKFGGARAGGLPVPSSVFAGCAFRGPTGCSLEPADRPSACLVFACDDLRAELDAKPEGSAVHQLRRDLSSTFDRFLSAPSEPPRHDLCCQAEAASLGWRCGPGA
ncbi:MAG: hypothetical protein DRI90_04000 [Deltaproteobacteria bacterium]|nr:MAG: hypothetical protein DRI90_04000 [Deltaproteobacteria bacterium]